jgi:PhzF family phenazine biosynthesis protein
MEILRYTAFSSSPAGGNPAGVVLDAAGVSDADMSRTAADVGYSETAFVWPEPDGGFRIRYFSPRIEVPFCGHATIAAAVAYAERHGAGPFHLDTRGGPVEVTTSL